MKQFSYKILGFISVPLLVIGILETGIYFFHDKLFTENTLDKVFHIESSQYGWINKLDHDSIVVLAGGSCVRYGLSCNELDSLSGSQFKFVNVSLDARDPIATYFIIKNMDLKRVSAVYFGLDPWIYSKSYYMHRSMYMYLDFNLSGILLFSKEYDKSALLKRYKSLVKLIFLNKKGKPNEKYLKVPSDYGSIVLDGKLKILMSM